MEDIKKYFSGWWLLILILLILSGVIFTGLNYLGIIGTTIVERKVFENSYQKHEADKTASTIYKAQLANLRARLSNPKLDEETRCEIKAQIDSIEILISTKED